MRRLVKKYIIPHKGNNHTPHLLRTKGAVGLLVVIVSLFALAAGQIFIIKTTNLAAVLTPVLVDLTNADRQSQNLTTLKVSPVLEKAATLKANDMSTKGYFAHVSPEGYSPWHWFNEVGYSFIYAGENLAVNFTESQDVETAWMNSPGHRANILNDKFTEIGIATQTGTYEGRSAIFVVQLFGKPLTTATPKSTLTATVKPTAETANVRPVLKTGTVKSASTETPENVHVIESKGNFIAVQRVSSSTNALLTAQDNIAGTTAPSKYASVFERLFSEPRRLLMYTYSIVGLLILIVMSLMLAGEFKKHHMLHISYGLGLLIIMGSLMIGLSTLIPQIVIV